MRTFVTAAIVTASTLAACGPPAPEPARPVALPDPTPVGAAKKIAPLRTDAKAAAPDDLEVVFRINDMEQVRSEVVAAMPQIASAIGAASLGSILDLVVGPDVAAVVDPTYPMDLASFGKSGVAVSFAVRPEAEARLAETFELTADDDGLLAIKRSSSGRTGFNECAFVPGARPSMRVVCTDEPPALRSGAVYLARTVSAEPLDADVKLWATSRLLRSETKRSHGKRSSIIDALGDAFQNEIDRFELELRLKNDIEIVAALRTTGRASPIARALLPKTAAAPPPAFFRLPKDAAFAAHFAGGAPDDMKPLRDALGQDFVASMKTDGYGDAETQAFERQAAALFLTGGPLVVASGIGESGVTGVEKAVAAMETAKDPKAADAKARAALSAWTLAWMDEPSTKWVEGIKKLVKTADDAEKTRDKEVAKAAPAKDPSGTNTRLRLGGKPDAKWKLPEGSLEVLVDQTTRATNKTQTTRIFVVPKGKATWFGYGEDPAIVASRLRSVLDDKEKRGALESSPEAASLAKSPTVAAGLVAPFALVLEGTDASSMQRVRRMLEHAAKASSKGRDVLSFSATTDIAADGAQLRVRSTVSRKTFADVLASVVGP